MNSETAVVYEGTLTILICWCGMRHAVPKELRRFQLRQHRNGETVIDIYCPLGHPHVPTGKSEVEKVREQLDAERRRVASLTSRFDQEQASHRATKSQLTKAKNRAKAGVCPCCKRTFQQLARHMTTQHPEFNPESLS